jgi:hypothetical protein
MRLRGVGELEGKKRRGHLAPLQRESGRMIAEEGFQLH